MLKSHSTATGMCGQYLPVREDVRARERPPPSAEYVCVRVRACVRARACILGCRGARRRGVPHPSPDWVYGEGRLTYMD